MPPHLSLNPVKLIIGFISPEESNLRKTQSILEKRFGKIDYESEPLPFDYTDYYEKEFGKNLQRKFISFKKLINPAFLPEIKLASIAVEKRLSRGLKRTINIDPGYLDLAKLILATTKDYNHRIYLAKGIFAEVTLYYSGKSFKPWEWTYPDYRTGEYIAIFNEIRNIYAKQQAR